MRQPVNPNFERMRLEAERQRLAQLELQAESLAGQLEAQAETAKRDRDLLEAENAALKQALDARAERQRSTTTVLEERYEALAADLAERLAAEKQHRNELQMLHDSLKHQAAAERASASALQARCEELSTRLRSQTEADAQAKADVEDLRAGLAAEAAAAQQKAVSLESQIAAVAGQVAKVDESFSEPERLRNVIAPILSGALRDAGEEDRDQMASAIAPYVVGTIRSEILNSEDELIEAIHPRMGVLIAAAMSNAMVELNRKVDEALPLDRWIASIKGRLTGAPPAGWLLEDGGTFKVREAMLIDRHSGLLLANERSDSLANEPAPDEDLMAGMIAALQGFASDAYGKSGAGDLRRFSFTEDTVYLRGTPTKLLALRCTGVAPPEIEGRVDELLIAALDRLRGDDFGSEEILTLDAFNSPVVEEEGGIAASAIVGRGLGVIAAAVALIWGHNAVTSAHEARWLGSIEQAVNVDASLNPYPLSVTMKSDPNEILVSGLMPNQAAREALKRRIEWQAVPLPVVYDLALVSEVQP